jgi:DNA-binding response OmpR family regulator
MNTMEKRILIVEDETDIREAMAEAVTQAGFIVSTAPNGAVGLQAGTRRASRPHPS